ncbi:hypothetical protein D3C72_687750 [compost metagenome]
MMARTNPTSKMWFSTTKTGSISMPTDTKNSVTNRSRRGSTSASTWRCSSDWLMTRPAKKAPRANDSPIDWESAAVPKQSPITPRKKISLWRIIASRPRIGGKSRVPSTYMTPRNSATLPRAMAMGQPTPPPPSVRKGSSTSIGTTARSCRISHPSMTRPCTEPISRRSSKRRITMIVLERARMKPIRRSKPSV